LIGAVVVPLLHLANPNTTTGTYAAPPFGHFFLGTDLLGRDIFVRIFYGARASCEVALFSTAIAFLIGTALGLVAGYFRGIVETLISGLADLVLVLPGLVLLIVLANIRGPSAGELIVGMSVLLVPGFVRITRANTLAYMQREFVLAAEGLGASSARIMIRELLPNVLPTVKVYAITAAAHVFTVEGGLSFLGLGIPPPNASWGNMIAEGQRDLQTSPHEALIPALALLLTVLSLNILGGDRLQRSTQRFRTSEIGV
jgi:peptide/nickel transport system permease protein